MMLLSLFVKHLLFLETEIKLRVGGDRVWYEIAGNLKHSNNHSEKTGLKQ